MKIRLFLTLTLLISANIVGTDNNQSNKSRLIIERPTKETIHILNSKLRPLSTISENPETQIEKDNFLKILAKSFSGEECLSSNPIESTFSESTASTSINKKRKKKTFNETIAPQPSSSNNSSSSLASTVPSTSSSKKNPKQKSATPIFLTGIDCIKEMVLNYGLIEALEKHEAEVTEKGVLDEEKHIAFHLILNTCEKVAAKRKLFFESHPKIKKSPEEVKILNYFNLKETQEEQEFCLPCAAIRQSYETKIQSEKDLAKKYKIDQEKKDKCRHFHETITLDSNSPELKHFINLNQSVPITIDQLDPIFINIRLKVNQKTNAVYAEAKAKGIPLLGHRTNFI